MNNLRTLVAAVLAVLCVSLHGQVSRNESPATFNIATAELDQILTSKEGAVLDFSGNRYLDKGKVEMNTLNGDMRFVRVKLDYFSSALLMIQVNGEHSTQVFLMSDKTATYYRGKVSGTGIQMTRVEKDQIVVE